MQLRLAQLDVAWDVTTWVICILDVDDALIQKLRNHRTGFAIVADDVGAQPQRVARLQQSRVLAGSNRVRQDFAEALNVCLHNLPEINLLNAMDWPKVN